MRSMPAFLLTFALCVPNGLAQRMAMGRGAHPTAPAGRGSVPAALHHPSTRVFVGNGLGYRPLRRNSGSYGWPYFADYGSGYGSDSEPYQYPPPPPEAQAGPPAPPAAAESNPSLPSPLLLELHGDQWVEVQSFRSASEEPQPLSPGNQKPNPLPPAVLVFRDGHSEELSSYSIIGPVIYTKADYWASGKWTRKIQIADLDLPATLQKNQERGVKFELPSSPDEVMIRP